MVVLIIIIIIVIIMIIIIYFIYLIFVIVKNIIIIIIRHAVFASITCVCVFVLQLAVPRGVRVGKEWWTWQVTVSL